MHLTVWADGGVWSGPPSGPSGRDVRVRVQELMLFFNTTAADAGGGMGQLEFERRCFGGKGKGKGKGKDKGKGKGGLPVREEAVCLV